MTVLLQVKEYDRLIYDLHRVLRPGGLITVCEVDNRLFEVDQPPYETTAYKTLPHLSRGLDLVRASVASQGIDIEAVHRMHEWLQRGSPFWIKTAEKYE